MMDLLFVLLFALGFAHAWLAEAVIRRVQGLFAASPPAVPKEQATVVIAARNAADTIVPLLQDLYAQQGLHVPLQVIVVDDASTDDTVALAQGLGQRWDRLRILSAQGVGKKAALSTAIETLEAGVVLQLDADTRVGPAWAATALAHMHRSNAGLLILPVSTLGNGQGLQRLQEDEQAALVLLGLGFADAGRPVLINGANMAYTVESFRLCGGFQGDRAASGDDMSLLLRMRARGLRVAVAGGEALVARTTPSSDLAGYFRQRIRWAGKMFRMAPAALVVPALALAYPWGMVALALRMDWAAMMGEGAALRAALWCAGMLCWLLAVPRMVRAGRQLFGMPRGRAPWLSYLLFGVLAPIIGLAALVYRPEWKGRRV